MATEDVITKLQNQIKKCDDKKPYIFISYKRSDAIKVYEIVLELQKAGVNLWIDKEIRKHIGKSWQDPAFDAISKPRCKGILFFVSKSALCSPPIFAELSYSKDRMVKMAHRNKELPILSYDLDNLIEEHCSFDNYIQDVGDELFDNKIDPNVLITMFPDQKFGDKPEDVAQKRLDNELLLADAILRASNLANSTTTVATDFEGIMDTLRANYSEIFISPDNSNVANIIRSETEDVKSKAAEEAERKAAEEAERKAAEEAERKAAEEAERKAAEEAERKAAEEAERKSAEEAKRKAAEEAERRAAEEAERRAAEEAERKAKAADIKPLAANANDDTNLHGMLYKFMNNYNECKLAEKNSKGEDMYDTVQTHIPDHIMKFLSNDKYFCKGSTGAGGWAICPWIAVFISAITNSTTKGVYIVYLLNAATKELYLTLNQGMTTITREIEDKMRIKKNFFKDKGFSKKDDYIAHVLMDNAENIRKEIGIGNFSAEKINSGKWQYDAGCICSKKYTVDDLPNDAALQNDLMEMLDLYERYYQKHITEFSDADNNSVGKITVKDRGI